MAVAAALPAVATAQVTISGLLDFAYGNSSGFQKGQTVSTRDFTSATSSIRFTATEDLGGGMRATVQYDLDPRVWINNDSGIVRNESFLGLSGGFGNIRLGSPNSIGLTTFLIASPLGTGIGSGYGNVAAAYSFVRHSRSLRYDSPSFGGVVLSFNYAPGGDNLSGAANSGTSGSQVVPVAQEVQEFGASYSAGPLSLGAAFISLPSRTHSVTTAVGNAGIRQGSRDQTLLSGRFTVGTTQLSAHWNNGDLINDISATDSIDGIVFAIPGTAGTLPARNPLSVTGLEVRNYKVDGWRLGVQHDMGAISLRGSYAVQNIEAAGATPLLGAGATSVRSADWSVLGLRADYSLSKRSALYVGFEQWEVPSEISDDSAVKSNSKRTLTSVGMRHSF